MTGLIVPRSESPRTKCTANNRVAGSMVAPSPWLKVSDHHTSLLPKVRNVSPWFQQRTKTSAELRRCDSAVNCQRFKKKKSKDMQLHCRHVKSSVVSTSWICPCLPTIAVSTLFCAIGTADHLSLNVASKSLNHQNQPWPREGNTARPEFKNVSSECTTSLNPLKTKSHNNNDDTVVSDDH